MKVENIEKGVWVLCWCWCCYLLSSFYAQLLPKPKKGPDHSCRTQGQLKSFFFSPFILLLGSDLEFSRFVNLK